LPAKGRAALARAAARRRGEDGMTIARALRTSSAIPIIMLTGVRDEADRVMGLELGADDYLIKPFSARELLTRIRTVMRRARERRWRRLAKARSMPFASETSSSTCAPGGSRGRTAVESRSLRLGPVSFVTAAVRFETAQSPAVDTLQSAPDGRQCLRTR